MEELTVLILCVVLTLVLAASVAYGAVRLVGVRKDLKAEAERAKTPVPRIVSVRQAAGEVRIAYLAFPVEGAQKASKPEPAPQAVPEKKEAPAAEPAEGETDSVLIPRAEKLSFAEKYERLPEDARGYLDEFTAYITAKEDCGKLPQASTLCFRYKKGQIAKASIRRDTVVLSFPIANPSLGRMLREEKIKGVKMQPAQIRLTGADELALAKQTADIAVRYLREEEEYKIERRKEARRERRRAEAERGGEEAQ